ncbi:hypothetical protein [Salinicoccus carnicancri]|uniref:hypothetical protein n=1 Tax=Salinicoccus carnicancri TaxID=558170 RepID=UPI00030F40AA|nr:hypothetical protein [Salinicoccus carnicancri]
MKRLSKLLIAAVIAGIAVGILLVSRSGGDSIGEEEVSAMVTDRYGGEIENISQTEDGQSYIVTLANEEYRYEITVSAEDAGIEGIVTEKNEDGNRDTASGSEEDASTETSEEKPAGEKTDTKKDRDQQEEEKTDALITEDEAKNIASGEVGGQFVHLTLNQETHPQQYQIIQLVEDDDEGALVTVDAMDGKAMNILWFQADFNEIADIEAFARQLQEYSTQYQNNHYIEFDDDSEDGSSGEDDDEDDNDDD